MKILAFSDTHGLHRELPPPPDHDIAIFAGDCGGERMGRFLDFVDWFTELTDKPKVMIYGNHERWAEKNPEMAKWQVESRCVHLLMGNTIAIDGMKIWGAPWTPIFYDWAFMDDNYDWEQMPDAVDVLVTHGPPKGILDQTDRGDSAGDSGLASALLRRDIGVHIFGHIHEARGIEGVHHNVSSVTSEYELYPDPWTLIEL